MQYCIVRRDSVNLPVQSVEFETQVKIKPNLILRFEIAGFSTFIKNAALLLIFWELDSGYSVNGIRFLLSRT